MSGPLPMAITVSPRQRAVLERLLRQHSCPQALARRSTIILAAGAGERNEPLAARLGCAPTTMRRWRRRWAAAQPDLDAVDDDEALLRVRIAEVLADAPPGGPPHLYGGTNRPDHQPSLHPTGGRWSPGGRLDAARVSR